MKQATLTTIVPHHHPFYRGLAANLQKYELKRGEWKKGKGGLYLSSCQRSYRAVHFYQSKEIELETAKLYFSFDLKQS